MYNMKSIVKKSMDSSLVIQTRYWLTLKEKEAKDKAEKLHLKMQKEEKAHPKKKLIKTKNS